MDVGAFHIVALIACGMGGAVWITDRESPTSRALGLFLAGMGGAILASTFVPASGPLPVWTRLLGSIDALAFVAGTEWGIRVGQTVASARLIGPGRRMLRTAQLVVIGYAILVAFYPELRARDVSGALVRRVAQQIHHGGGYVRVHALAAGRGEVGEERLADLLVHEAVHDLTTAALAVYKDGVFSLFERVEQRVLVESRGRKQQAERRGPADHRGCRERFASGVTDPLESPLDHKPYRARDLGVGDGDPRAPTAVGVEQHTALFEVQEHLFHEEGVALGFGVHE